MIRVGIIGCGGIAMAHARTIAAFPSRAALAAAADVRPERLELFVERYGVRSYGRAEDLLAQEDIRLIAQYWVVLGMAGMFVRIRVGDQVRERLPDSVAGRCGR